MTHSVYKQCTRCSETKPLTEFHKAPSTVDGRLAWCRDCKRAYDARYRAGERVALTPWPLRFLGYIGEENEDGCIVWTGAPDDRDYGVLGVGGGHRPRPVRAHRLAYQLVKGAIPVGHHVHHTCGNKLCVNPNHLETMTKSEHHRLHAQRRKQ